MKEFEFNLKTKLKLGKESALNISDYLKDFKVKKIGVVVDENISNLDYVKNIISNLKEFELKVWNYNLKAEPDYDSLDKIKGEFKGVDSFLAIGGGSVIDFAKGLAVLAVNEGLAITYRGFPKSINHSLPVIALPTTAGTASEVTYNAVFIDKQSKKKFGINTMDNFPVLAVLDPLLIAGSPKKTIASSGMDALTHILESYIAVQSNELTRMFAKKAFELVFNNLPKVFENNNDLEAIEKLQLGAYLAGVSLMNSGSGPAGALSYSLGVHFKVPHGIAGAMFIPYTVLHNFERGYDYSELAESLPQKLFDLCCKLEIPKSLKEFGVDEKNIGLLLENIEGFEKAFAQNPIPFTIEDGKNLFKKLLN